MPARLLTYADADEARRIVERDPVRNVFMASRLDAGVLDPMSPGAVWGWPADGIESLLHVGANMAPAAASPAAIAAFVDVVGLRRTCQAIIGPSVMVLPLWRALCTRGGPVYSATHEVRARQPVMAISGEPAVPADPRVRPITMRDFESYVAASIAMYTEEVGSQPSVHASSSAYRAHCQWLVEHERAFGIVSNGRVVFKADIGAASGGVGQLQGVWLDPALRGHGLSAPAVAAVVRFMLARYLTVSLYVNDFNGRALACYRRVGFEVVDEFATVLY